MENAVTLAQQGRKTVEIEPGLVEEICSRFAHVDSCPFDGPRVFFENAGGALTLNTVVAKSAEMAVIPDNQGRNNPASHALQSIIDEAKRDTRIFFNAPEGQVFVGESGTELLFRLISAACLGSREDGRIVGSSLEDPATRSPATAGATKPGRTTSSPPTGGSTSGAFRQGRLSLSGQAGFPEGTRGEPYRRRHGWFRWESDGESFMGRHGKEPFRPSSMVRRTRRD